MYPSQTPFYPQPHPGTMQRAPNPFQTHLGSTPDPFQTHPNFPAPADTPEDKPTTGPTAYDGLDPTGAHVSAQGYVACVIVFCEGVLLLLHVAGILLPDLFFYPPSSTSPFKTSEQVYLWVVALGDLFTAIFCAMGIWVGRNMLPMGWRQSSKLSGSIALWGTGSMVAWRWLVLLSCAPWAGIWLAFEGPHFAKVAAYIILCLYILFSIALVFVLSRVFRQTVSDSLCLQKHLDEQARHERKQLLYNASQARLHNFHADGHHMHDHEVEPYMFGIFPLPESITLYALVIAFACTLASFWLLFTWRTVGGWAFFAEKPRATTTFWLELFVYVTSIAFAIIGLAGCLLFSGVRSEVIHAFIRDDASAVNCIMIFLLGSMLRFALLFAVTGMAFLENNTCGFYVHGLSQLTYGAPWSHGSEYWLTCQPLEYLLILAVLIVCALDAYFIWGTFQLWHFAQDWTLVYSDINPKGGDYGAALEDNHSHNQ